MRQEQATFHSDGIRLEGAFFFPDKPWPESAPLVLACSGFMGLRDIHPERFARSLTARGYPCFGFDYRGFPPSGGPPRRVLLEEQVRDIRHAAAFALAHEKLARAPLVLLGWGMGAGLVLQAGRWLSRLRGLVCVNGFYDGARVQRTVRGQQGWEQFAAWAGEERRRAAATGEALFVDPFEIYPLDPVTRGYVDGVLRKNPGFGGEVDTILADSLLGFAPERLLDELAEVPLLVAHGDQNALHPTQEARELHRRYPGPKELYWVEGGGHTEWMHDDDPKYRALAARIADWLEGIR